MARRGLPTNLPLQGRAHLSLRRVRGRPARVRAGGARTAQGARSWQRCAGIPVRGCPLIPPAPFSHTGRRGSLGVLMPETKDGTPGLPQKPATVSPPIRRSPTESKGMGGVLMPHRGRAR